MDKVSFGSVPNASGGRAGRRALGVIGKSALGAARKKKRRRRTAAPPRLPVIQFGPRVATEEACVQSFADFAPGERAVGGGYGLFTDDARSVTFLASNPDQLKDGAAPTSWFASVCTAAGTRNIQAYAACVPD